MDRAEAIRHLESMATDLTGACVAAHSDKVSKYIERKIQAIDMAIAALREQETVTNCNEWISVKERLPEKDEYVWCFSNKNGGYMFIGYRGWITGEWMECGSMHIADVTHWMPLPEPPKGE